jgi:hypothetical protein
MIFGVQLCFHLGMSVRRNVFQRSCRSARSIAEVVRTGSHLLRSGSRAFASNRDLRCVGAVHGSVAVKCLRTRDGHTHTQGDFTVLLGQSTNRSCRPQPRRGAIDARCWGSPSTCDTTIVLLDRCEPNTGEERAMQVCFTAAVPARFSARIFRSRNR